MKWFSVNGDKLIENFLREVFREKDFTVTETVAKRLPFLLKSLELSILAKVSAHIIIDARSNAAKELLRQLQSEIESIFIEEGTS